MKLLKYKSSKKIDDETEKRMSKVNIETAGSTKGVVNTPSSMPEISGSGYNKAKTSLLDKVKLANEKTSRTYAQSAADMQPVQSTGLLNKLATYKPVGNNPSEVWANKTAELPIVNRTKTLPSVSTVRTPQIAPVQSSMPSLSNLSPYRNNSVQAKSQGGTAAERMSNEWLNATGETPQTITKPVSGTLSGLRNVLSSYGDTSKGADVTIKANLKQSIANESNAKKYLSDMDNTINNLITTRNKYPVGSEKYSKINKTIDDMYSYADEIRNRPTDNTEGSTWFNAAAEKQRKAVEGLSGAKKELAEAGISVGDNLVTIALSGGVEPVALAMLGAKSAGSRMNELNQQGVSAADALGRGALSGVIEAATEKIGMDNLYDIVLNKKTNLMANLLKQMASEGSEEALGYLANYGTDTMFGDKNAKFDWNELAENTIQGALSGAMFGLGGTAVSTIGNKVNGSLADLNYKNNAPNVESYKNAKVLPMSSGTNNSINITNVDEIAKQYGVTLPDVQEFQAQEITSEQPINISKPITTKEFKDVYENEDDLIPVEKGLSETDVNAYNFIKKIADKKNASTNKIYDAYKKSRNSLLESVLNDNFEVMKNYTPQGTQLVYSDSYVPDGYGQEVSTGDAQRVSNNEKWYSEVYKEYGHKPNQSQLKQFIEKKVLNDVKRGGGEFVPVEIAKKLSAFDSLLSGYDRIANNSVSGDVLEIRQNESGNYEVDYGDKTQHNANQNSTSQSAVLTHSADEIMQTRNKFTPLERKVIDKYIDNTIAGANKTLAMKMDKPQGISNSSISFTPQEQTIITKYEDELSGITPMARTINPSKGDKQSKFASSIQEQNIYDDTFKNEAAKDNTIGTYDGITNKGTMDLAASKIKSNFQSELNRFNNIKPEDADATDIAEGFIFMEHYQNVKDYDSMIAVAERLRSIGTTAGQTVQAFSIMKRMTPEGMVMYAQKSLDDAFDTLKKGKSNEWVDENKGKYNLTPEDAQFITERMEKVQSMPDGRDKDILLGEIQAKIQSKIPASQSDKIRTLARISMLFNAKTQVRNILGNVVVAPQVIASDAFGSLLDKAISKKTGVRTTGLYNPKSLGQLPSGVQESWYDYRHGINTRDVSNDMRNLGANKSFSENGFFGKTVGKSLNNIDSFTSFMLDAGDRGFYKMWYENSLNNQKRLNGVTEATEDMKNIARADALQRTWQDDNSYTKFVYNLKNAFNRVNIKGYGVGDVILPFVKTPANLTKAVVDYSPIGVVNALVNDATTLKDAIRDNKNVAAAQRTFASNLSKGITGTILLAIITSLVKKGVITGDKDDDKDVANFQRYIMGKMPFSINIGDKSYSYESLQPVGGSMAIIANANTAYSNSLKSGNSKTESSVNAILDGTKAMGSTLFNLSFMESVSEFMSEGDIVSGGINAVLNELSKFTPAALGQVAQHEDGQSRRTYEYGNTLGTALNKSKAKIPGLRDNLEPVIDTLGREYIGNNSMFDTFLNPANYYKNNANAVSNEINSLYNETGNKTVIPPVAPYYIDYKNERTVLTPSQYTKYQKTTGSIINESVDDLLSNYGYDKISNDDKVAIYNDIYSYATDMAKSKAISGYELKSSDVKAQEAAKNGLSEADYFYYKYFLDSTDNNESKYEYLANSDASQEGKDYLALSLMSDAKNEDYSELSSAITATDFYGVDAALENTPYKAKTSGAKSQAYKSTIDSYLKDNNIDISYADRMKLYESFGVGKTYRY